MWFDFEYGKSGSGILAFDTTGNKQELGIYQIQWFEEEKKYI